MVEVVSVQLSVTSPERVIVSLRASEPAHGPPIRKSTRYRQVNCDLRYTLELFTWFSPNYTTKMALQNPLKISHLNGIFLRKQFLLLFSKNGVEELA